MIVLALTLLAVAVAAIVADELRRYPRPAPRRCAGSAPPRPA